MSQLLEVSALNAHIQGVHVLRELAMQVAVGETVALIGRNGAGKTTLLRTVMGFVEALQGTLGFAGEDLRRHPPHRRPYLGIGYAPEDRRLFAAFDVETNLLLPAQVCRLPTTTVAQRLELVYTVLPELKELRGRPAGSVSGGQGKMVALGRALMVGTRLVLLDEPFQGLAPVLANRYAEALRQLRDQTREVALLITESNPALLHNFADTTYVIERGEVQRVAQPS